MRALVLVVLTALLASCSNEAATDARAVPQATELWQGVRYGMTVEEVAQAYPGDMQLLDPDVTPDGLDIVESRRTVDILDRKFNPEFSFDEKTSRLVGVALDSGGDLSDEESQNIFAGVQAQLTRKYGQPLTSTRQRDTDIRYQSWRVEWVDGPRSISLTRTSFGGVADITPDRLGISIYYKLVGDGEDDDVL